MNGFMSKGQVEYYKKTYPPGTRVQIDYMEDPYAIPSGTKGTVQYVDDAGQLGMKWDNGRTLSICPEVDSFHVMQQEEVPTEETDIEQTM